MHLKFDKKYGSAEDEIGENVRWWLLQLPIHVEPETLLQNFPRISNRIAELWPDIEECGRYLDLLLLGTEESSRNGFPYQTAMEICHLRALTLFNQCLPTQPNADLIKSSL
jgi:hypothetical protein